MARFPYIMVFKADFAVAPEEANIPAEAIKFISLEKKIYNLAVIDVDMLLKSKYTL